MPVNNSLMDSLRKKYGRKRGTSVYYGMEQGGSKGFRKGLKTASSEGHTSTNLAAYKKRKRKGRKA